MKISAPANDLNTQGQKEEGKALENIKKELSQQMMQIQKENKVHIS